MKPLLKQLLKAFTVWALRILDYLVPKDNRMVLLSTGNYGNTKAIYDYIRSHDCGLQAYCYGSVNPETQADDHLIKNFYNISSLWKALRAKTVISTHTSNFYLSSNKLCIETWHGVALKGQMLTEKNMEEKSIRKARKLWTKHIDIFIAPSKEAAYRMCVSYMIDPRKIFYCGQARNDVLFREKRDIAKVCAKLGLPECKKLILYCPTYRRKDSIHYFPFSDMDYEDFSRLLVKNDAFILLRSHNMAAGVAGAENNSRIFCADREVWPDVNELLPHIDMLITDYSSIYYDYLILDRPIIFIPYDLAQYEQECGLVVDDYDWWTPGDKVQDYAGFKQSVLQGLTGVDSYMEARQTIDRVINYYQDGDSCKKTVEMIKQRLGIRE